jgi:hypothetical protein
MEGARDARQIAILQELTGVRQQQGLSAMSDSTTEAILRALAAPAVHANGFDPHAHLCSLLQGVGLAPEDSGGAIQFTGQDPVIANVFRIASAAGIGLVAKSVAVAAQRFRE